MEAAARLVEAGIPVMGHLGLLPQSVHQLGGYRQQARRRKMPNGCWRTRTRWKRRARLRVVLESIPAEVAATVTAELRIPTIGIGAGPHCDGQVLVSYDMLGLSQDAVPPFVRRYADLGEQTVAAARAYAEDVRAGRFPAAIPRYGGLLAEAK